MEDTYSSNMSDLNSGGKNDPTTDLQNLHGSGGNIILDIMKTWFETFKKLQSSHKYYQSGI